MESFTAHMPLLAKPAQLDQGEDTRVLFNSVIYAVSGPISDDSTYTRLTALFPGLPG